MFPGNRNAEALRDRRHLFRSLKMSAAMRSGKDKLTGHDVAHHRGIDICSRRARKVHSRAGLHERSWIRPFSLHAQL